jgi:hypothetical protein
MNAEGKQVVFHGSSHLFEIAKPNFTQRISRGGEVTYQGTSLHATPHLWIALAYTATKGGSSNFGVSLFTNDKIVLVFGTASLDQSLTGMYGGDRYVYEFPAESFAWKKGLGPLEVVSFEEQKPLKTITVHDAVATMKEAGVKFVFVRT